MTPRRWFLMAVVLLGLGGGVSWGEDVELQGHVKVTIEVVEVARPSATRAKKDKANAELDKATRDYRQEQQMFGSGADTEAVQLYQQVADRLSGRHPLGEEARYHQARCLFAQYRYPAAADAFVALLREYPCSSHSDEACQSLYDIANYWLDDTREEMGQAREVCEGRRWLVWPQLLHWDRSRPFVQEEKRAVELLQVISDTDPTGPHTEKALFLLGSIAFYRDDFAAAEQHFDRLVEQFPRGALVEKALELTVISKVLVLDQCPDRQAKAQEVQNLIHSVLEHYPELSRHKQEFFQRQLAVLPLRLSHHTEERDTDPFYQCLDAVAELLGDIAVELTERFFSTDVDSSCERK